MYINSNLESENWLPPDTESSKKKGYREINPLVKVQRKRNGGHVVLEVIESL